MLINIILPIFLIIVVGYVAGTTKIVSTTGIQTINNFVFYIALPALLFHATATVPFEELLNWQFIAANLSGIFGSFLVAFVISKSVFKHSRQEASLYGMNASYGTTGYMGIPLVIAAFGPDAALPAALATLLHNIPIIMIVLLLCEDNSNKNVVLKRLKPIFTSPLTISVALGFIVSALQLPLPTAVNTFTSLLANASGATALFAIGLSFVGQFAIRKEQDISLNEVSIIVALKLFLQPLITFLCIHFLFDLDPLWAAVSLVMAALPVGAGVFVFAQKYNVYTRITLVAIMVSIVLSFFSLTFFINRI